jgi:hypothetical protein
VTSAVVTRPNKSIPVYDDPEPGMTSARGLIGRRCSGGRRIRPAAVAPRLEGWYSGTRAGVEPSKNHGDTARGIRRNA